MSNYNHNINSNNKVYNNAIKKGIKINNEYAKLVPSLTLQEYASLKNSIKENQGNIIPIIVNQDDVVLDGHHRFRACQELEITPKIEIKEFADEFEEKEFIISINRNRRHLNRLC